MAIDVITYDIPPEENSEPGCPESITHDCDYMLLEDGSVDFHYNLLIYTWQLADAKILARAYLDDVASVSVFITAARLQTEPALQPCAFAGGTLRVT